MTRSTALFAIIALLAYWSPAVASTQADTDESTEANAETSTSADAGEMPQRLRVATIVGASGASVLAGGLILTSFGLAKTATDDCDVDDCDATADMFKIGAGGIAIGAVLGVTALIIANTGAETRLDATASGAPLIRTRIAGDLWLSPQGLHF